MKRVTKVRLSKEEALIILEALECAFPYDKKIIEGLPNKEERQKQHEEIVETAGLLQTAYLNAKEGKTKSVHIDLDERELHGLANTADLWPYYLSYYYNKKEEAQKIRETIDVLREQWIMQIEQQLEKPS